MKTRARASDGYRLTLPEAPFLLAADLDGTLVGDDEGEQALAAIGRSSRGSCYLAVVTGRGLSSVQRLVTEGRLPPPDFVASSVGTELLACGDSTNALGRKYAARAPRRWSLESIYALGQGDGIRRQAFPGGQPPFHAGFDWDGRMGTLTALRRRLVAGLEFECRIVDSFGRYVDVVPPQLGKGELVRFLQTELGIDHERVVVAGDSGNDRGMFETGFKGIVPINALDELKAVASQPCHYHSPYPAARGVIDGLCHFGFLAPTCA